MNCQTATWNTAWAIQGQAVALLTAAGYQNYEVSAWASNERFSQHNLNYWLFGDYIAAGAGTTAAVAASTAASGEEEE